MLGLDSQNRATIVALLLRAAGADTTLVNSDGQTALELARLVGCIDGTVTMTRLGSTLSSCTEARRYVSQRSPRHVRSSAD